MIKIAILDDYQGAALSSADWSAVDARAEITVFSDHLDDLDALVRRLEPFDAVCIMRERTKLPADLLARLPKLRFIGSNAPHNAAIDLDAATRYGIVVSSTGGKPNGTPELTWALILAAARRIPVETAAFRSGGWQRTVGLDLAGRTLGLVGLGNIGRRVATVGRAFGMEVLAWSDNLTDAAAIDAGARRVTKRQLFEQADWVSLHLVLSDRTRGLVGAEELAAMRPSAWLVNTARGPLVDETALVDALRRGVIAGAALDVFDHEPLPPDHPLRTLPNVLATPHVGFVTEDTYRVFYGETVENLLAWMNGAPIRQMRS
ncbi:D-2-hydroxyacid dehydrogenase family protein [Rhizosaccharibacter radicis]|uniref:D-2-hydroxyacid dehydrogenase family protein n=1 Tax=Rhizosaccharibacter radicis TaxID=2782605 RepID=A0ABT1VZ83_9PROT|nr:D-2-hydroxyacid dehydrogenase family protein [Acetobacteraceae bacterium KSS12]